MASLSRFEGCLLTDHSQGPGIGRYTGHAKIEEATIGCVHCGTVFVKNPDRERPREYCRKCDRYLCDACALASTQPTYIHRSFAELADLVRSGKWQITGPLSNPILIPAH